MKFRVFGETLVKLRKRSGMTQNALAEKLGLSNKTVSKWENSETLPEIPALLRLADIFGVSVDYLLQGEKRSIAIAGSLLVDMAKDIDRYPEEGMLARITDCRQSVGGCVPNTAINLAKMDSSIPLSAWGCVGDDENGHYIISKIRQYNINVNSITVLPKVHTSFCDVMNLPSGKRVFFNALGANAHFGPEHIDIAQLQCYMLHMGYALLLDRFDRQDEEYGTVMARFLCAAQAKGIKTSLDIASESDADYGKKVVPALKYVNYLICNETECCSCFNIVPRNSDGSLNAFNIKSAMRRALSAGVSDKVIVHAKEAGFVLDKSGAFTCVPSLDIPDKDIVGRACPGDTFCAASLIALYNGVSDKELLEFASAAAACSLFSENGIDSMKKKGDILKMMKESRRLKLDI